MTDNPSQPDKLPGMNFGEALQRLTQTDPQELAILTNADMKDGEIERLIAAFEASAQFDGDGNEFWSARDLQTLLEYDRWENFESAIRRAQVACRSVGQAIEDHFREATKMVELGSNAAREVGVTENLIHKAALLLGQLVIVVMNVHSLALHWGNAGIVQLHLGHHAGEDFLHREVIGIGHKHLRPGDL